MGENRAVEGVSKRQLHVIFLVDCSGSMEGNKIESLNQAIKEAIPHLRDLADERPDAEIMIRIIKFSTGATWHISSAPIPVKDFEWVDLEASGMTAMGKALSMVAEQLKVENMPARGLPPLLVLVSDGQPTDNFNGGLKKLMDQPWGKKAARVAIAIGDDADKDVLKKFIGNPELPVLEVKNAEALKTAIKWASTTVAKALSKPASRPPESTSQNGNISYPNLPNLDEINKMQVDVNDVF